MLYLALYISPILFSSIRPKENPHEDYSRWGGEDIIIYLFTCVDFRIASYQIVRILPRR